MAHSALRIATAALLTLGAALPASARPLIQQTSEQTAHTYRCQGDVQIPVVFVNPPQSDTGYAATVLDGKLMILKLAVSASGLRYRSETPEPGYQLWVKGEDAFVTKGPETAEETLADDCKLID